MIIIMGIIMRAGLLCKLLFSVSRTPVCWILSLRVLSAQEFTSAFKNSGFLYRWKVSGLFALVVVTSEVIIGTAVALLLNEPLKG